MNGIDQFWDKVVISVSRLWVTEKLMPPPKHLTATKAQQIVVMLDGGPLLPDLPIFNEKPKI